MSPQRDDNVSVQEIAALTARLRGLVGRGADDRERSAFLADKRALLARMEHEHQYQDHPAVQPGSARFDELANDDGHDAAGWSR